MHDPRKYLLMQPTRVFTVIPDEPLEPESEIDALEIDFKRTGAAMIVGFRGSIRAPFFTGLDSDAWLSSLFFRLWFNDDEAYTTGTLVGRQVGSLSLTQGWTSFEVCFSRLDTTFHPFWRWVTPADKMYVALQNRSTFFAPLWPTMAFGIVKEKDFRGPDIGPWRIEST